MPGIVISQTDRLRRRGLALAGLTVAWNVVEAAVAITAGVAASSIALIGFGFDSTIEVMSALVVAWQFSENCTPATTRTVSAAPSG